MSSTTRDIISLFLSGLICFFIARWLIIYSGQVDNFDYIGLAIGGIIVFILLWTWIANFLDRFHHRHKN